jgi:hypothetical protein
VAEARPTAAIPACILAWLVPGAGHLYLKRYGKALVFFACLGALFVLGVAMNARLEPPRMDQVLDDILASLFSLAQMAVGIPYFVVRGAHLDTALVTSPTFEYGNTFTAVAGLLNVLVILDAYDVAVGRKA